MASKFGSVFNFCKIRSWLNTHGRCKKWGISCWCEWDHCLLGWTGPVGFQHFLLVSLCSLCPSFMSCVMRHIQHEREWPAKKEVKFFLIHETDFFSLVDFIWGKEEPCSDKGVHNGTWTGLRRQVWEAQVAVNIYLVCPRECWAGGVVLCCHLRQKYLITQGISLSLILYKCVYLFTKCCQESKCQKCVC